MITTKNILILSACAALIFTASSCVRISDPRTSETQDKLDMIANKYMKLYHAPGMILGVWVPGKGGYVKAYGRSDIKSNIKMKENDRFRMGSNTKIFVATVIMQLADEGRLDLNDKLSKYYPGIPYSDMITLKMLMNHTSGLFNYSEDADFGKTFQEGHLHSFAPEDLISYALKHKPYFQPGQGFHYSNTNTALLGMIIEKITGNTLDAEIKNRFIDKLGLNNTYFPKGTDTGGPIAHGYMIEGAKYYDWTKMDVSWGWAAGAMISNVYDMEKFATAVTDGSLLSRKLQRERMNSWVAVKALKDFPTARYGYNVFTFGGYVGHNGGLPGFISYMVRNPRTGVTLVMMMNIQPDDSEASLKILKDVIGIVSPGTKV